ncbi:allophanate hydrolase [Donghicola sp. XS_ASV15]|uniref:allophanate hydrolase n=1 Tax=Donghicola sp. XS_ASV15 TaxID=3241295 RepID=UPI003518ADAB
MTIPLTLSNLQAAFAAGTTVETIIEQVYERIAEVDDPSIFITLRDKADVLTEAATLGTYNPDKPLWGVPFAVKDNIDVAGLPTSAACPAYEYFPDKDAFVVGLLRAAGALVIGKTNLDQFATGLVGVRTPYGAPRNSVDPDIVPGGSSGGSGVSVGHGIVSFSLGTDTAGSGRVPAALNNIVGLKPTLGAWSARGSVPACRSVETISVFALTVEDAYKVYQVGAVYDALDAYAKPVVAGPIAAMRKNLKIGVPNGASIKFFGDDVQAASFENSLELLRDAGHKIVPIDFTPLYDIAQMLYEGAWVAERHSVIQDLLESNPEAVHPVTAKIIRHAESLSATDAFRGFYRLKELSRTAEPMLEGLDLLCVPTIPTFYSVSDLEADPVTPNSKFGTYTNFVNLLDMCGLAVPTPARSDGRPGSVTLLAKAGEDAFLAAVAAPLEYAGARTLGATEWPRPEPAAHAEIPEGYTKLAVCGAHMSGLPLNPQLTERGAYLLSQPRSAPYYSFHALAGAGVKRPGMVRTVEQQAAGIGLEVWAIPADTLGSFLMGIPAPLGLGKVELEDGSWVTGFICEAAGTTSSTDITELGDWRNYLNAQMESSEAAPS